MEAKIKALLCEKKNEIDCLNENLYIFIKNNELYKFSEKMDKLELEIDLLEELLKK